MSRLKLKTEVFSLIFFLVFCFSGLLSIISIISGQFNYRNGITVSLLAIPITFLFGIKLDKVTFAFIALTATIILSGLYNQSTLQQVIFFLRNVIFSFLIYNSVQICVRPENIKQIIKWCVIIAVIQLPIILFQRAIYPQLPASVHARISAIDIGTGTFEINGDSAMAFYLVLIIIFLLFNSKRNYFIRNKWLILTWLTLTIFIANADLLKLVVLLVWAVFFLVKFRTKKVFHILLITILVISVLAAFGFFNSTIERLSSVIAGSLKTDQGATDKFLSGSYARGAALNYYLTRGIRLLGDGPSKYYDPQTREKIIGNTGHLFMFYSEVGLLGWLCSVVIFILIAFPLRAEKNRVSWSRLLNFTSIMLITLTSYVMDNTAVMLIYCIMAMTHLIPEKEHIQNSQNESQTQFLDTALIG